MNFKINGQSHLKMHNNFIYTQKNANKISECSEDITYIRMSFLIMKMYCLYPLMFNNVNNINNLK